MQSLALPFLGVLAGLALLVWSADKFVEGSAATARHFDVPPLLIGMVIVGFGTSAPEMVVSAMSASQGNPGIALGNAYGSNIANIGLILGITALICPIAVHSQVIRKELPILIGITLLSSALLWDLNLSRVDAAILIAVFAGLMAWSVREGMKESTDALGEETEQELIEHAMPLGRALMWIGIGLALLIASSRLLVWGAVEIATSFGVSDLIIGLTIVAVGTSLPELASSITAARKNEPDIALGNIVGSNLFNTLAVVGIAGSISPFAAPPEIMSRDLFVVGAMTVALVVVCYGFKGPGIINRFEGAALLAAYIAYTAWITTGVVTG